MSESHNRNDIPAVQESSARRTSSGTPSKAPPAEKPLPPVYSRRAEPPAADQPRTAPSPEEPSSGGGSADAADAAGKSPFSRPGMGAGKRRRRQNRESGGSETDLDPWDFDEDVDVFAATDGTPTAVETDDGILISWEPKPNVTGQVVYVVAASDERPVELLYQAERLAATSGRSVVVTKGAGPHFGIFAFEGIDLEAAKQTTGTPHGTVTLLREVRDVAIEAFASVVILRWRKPADVSNVLVLRSRPNESLPDGFLPRYVVANTDANMLHDKQIEPGVRYTYRIYSLGASGQRSMGVTCRVVVPEQPIAVTDLQADVETVRGGDPWVNLTYTDPGSGRVTIFESSTPPHAVSDDQLFEAAELERIGLGSALSAYPVQLDDGRMLLSGVYSTAQGSSRYYTPVTAGDDRYRVGRTAVVHYVGVARNAEIVDRVSWQLLRFRWPAGAETVVCRIGPPGAKDATMSGPEISVSRNAYDRDGGVKFGSLSDRGATVFIRGKYFDGRDHVGAWASVSYPGRVKLAYRLIAGSGNTVSLQIWSERPLNRVVVLVLSHPTQWLRSTQQVPGTERVEKVDWQLQIPPGVWVTVREGIRPPRGRVRAFFYVPEVPPQQSLMVLDPLPMQPRSPRQSLISGVRDLVDKARTARGNEPAELGPTYARCPTCFELYAEDQAWLRCPPNGNCDLEPDYHRARLTREVPVPERRPVHPVSAAQAVGSRLPCPVCGEFEAALVCPVCHSDLPPGWNSDRTALYFTFVGATTSGKTTFLAVLLEQLRSVVLPMLGRLFQPLNYSTQRRLAAYRARLFEQGVTESGTRRISENLELLEPLIFDAGPNPNGQPAALVLHDVSGEDMKTTEDTARYAHLLSNSDCLIFLVDLLQLDPVREQVRGLSDGLLKLPDKVTEPAQVLMNVAQAIRQYRGQPDGRVDVRAAIALAKFDVFQLGMRNRDGALSRFISTGSVLMQDPYAMPDAPTGPQGLFFQADSEQVHLEARDLLERLGARDFLNTLDISFADFRFFAVSALGHTPLNGQNIEDSGVSAFRLADAVRWVMSERWYG